MIKIIISGNKYTIPESWKDVTMRQLLNSQSLLKEMPDKLNKITFPENEKDEPPEITDEDEKPFWEFYRKWVKYWTGISQEVSMKIHMDDLKRAYEILQVFMYAPESMDFKGVIEFNDVTYMLPKAETLMGGNVKHMADSTYEEFVEGMQLSSGINKLQDGDLSALSLLTATFYREQVTTGNWMNKRTEPVPYDEEGTKKRAEIFMGLPMDKVWGAYFFLCTYLEKSLNGLQTSLKEKAKAAGSLKDLVGTL